MAEYKVVANVDQIVTKQVQLIVQASSEEEATNKARDALQLFPKAIKVAGVSRVLTTKANYWIPKSIEFTHVSEEKIVA